MSNPNNGGMGFLGVVGAIIVAVLILSFAYSTSHKSGHPFTAGV